MQVNSQEHQKFLLEMFNQVSVPGKLLDLAIEVKRAVENAQIVPPPQKDGDQ